MRLILQPRQGLVLSRDVFRQDLYRDVSSKLIVLRFVHLPHAARTNQDDNFVRTYLASRYQAHLSLHTQHLRDEVHRELPTHEECFLHVGQSVQCKEKQ